MTRIPRMTTLASAALIAATLLTAGAVNAQTVRTPNVGGAVREYQAQPAPRTRPLREGVTGLGSDTQDVIREPRFIVEAVSFRAVDESGRTDLGSDEVFAVFRNGQSTMVTKVYGSVDTTDEESFEAGQSCIWPVAATSSPRERTWACAPEGGRGPISFSIMLYDLDPNYWSEWVGRFCIDGPTYGNTGTCVTRHSNLLFDSSFSYGVSEILGRLDPACRCFTETARHSQDHSTYDVTFRITRVDTAGEPLAVDRDPGPAGPVAHRSGTLTAQSAQRFELDGGTVGAAGDFQFSGSFLGAILTPNGGAKIWPGNATARGYDTCYAQRASANYVTTLVASPTTGQHACYVTSDGRVGEFRVDSLTQGANPALTITYTTWQ